ncbi:hypothetical protein CXG81DRAFT_23559 [Caulochytrium protostelioides]|uniref:Uncharacterized protein n=1 Tax=Caulochytrium protostelioides TaxID=1555241 RepID=A0A4P9XED4_9FUNG|nr:hypothetical protein CXG81DRAFT_23559 [Caulochytrium protostelioides]|eukprot:RKP03868.1 hypothetical protein CXG81DRAFT_23559 [Caulochytrium protostelioides]
MAAVSSPLAMGAFAVYRDAVPASASALYAAAAAVHAKPERPMQATHRTWRPLQATSSNVARPNAAHAAASRLLKPGQAAPASDRHRAAAATTTTTTLKRAAPAMDAAWDLQDKENSSAAHVFAAPAGKRLCSPKSKTARRAIVPVVKPSAGSSASTPASAWPRCGGGAAAPSSKKSGAWLTPSPLADVTEAYSPMTMNQARPGVPAVASSAAKPPAAQAAPPAPASTLHLHGNAASAAVGFWSTHNTAAMERARARDWHRAQAAQRHRDLRLAQEQRDAALAAAPARAPSSGAAMLRRAFSTPAVLSPARAAAAAAANDTAASDADPLPKTTADHLATIAADLAATALSSAWKELAPAAATAAASSASRKALSASPAPSSAPAAAASVSSSSAAVPPRSREARRCGAALSARVAASPTKALAAASPRSAPIAAAAASPLSVSPSATRPLAAAGRAPAAAARLGDLPGPGPLGMTRGFPARLERSFSGPPAPMSGRVSMRSMRSMR